VIGLEIVVVLGVTILLCSGLARRLHIAPPILLLVAGAALGFLPQLGEVQLPPEVVLYLFLPALLFRESLTTSLREIRANFRWIVLASTVLVVATAAVVAVVGHAFGLPWAAAWVLGAAVAPTDATAVGSFTRSLPRRDVTVLRAESLVNDGTALVIYGVAVSAVLGDGDTTPLHTSWLVVLAYGGGVLIGFVLGHLVVWLRERLHNPVQETVLMMLTPFVAYLIGESIGSSGVIAVVIAGLVISQAAPLPHRARTRRESDSFWSLATFLLNASLFVLVGLQVRAAAQGLDAGSIAAGASAVVAVSLIVIAVRVAFFFVAAFVIRVIKRGADDGIRRVSNRSRLVSGLSGFRGAVSLAAALGVPLVLPGGDGFPGRDFIVFVTSGVIVVTLIVQGLILPAVVRWASLPRDTGVDDEARFAEETATREALRDLPDVASALGSDPEVTDRLSSELRHHLHLLTAETSDESAESKGSELRLDRQYRALRLEILNRKRAAVVRLRDEGRVDDLALRQVQSTLDIEEMRLDADDKGSAS
jgi:CPA1 family monovalent cation:H+ antiporter